MEPLSVASIVASLVTTAAHTAMQLNGYRSKYQISSIILPAIVSECNVVASALSQIQALAINDPEVISSRLASRAYLRGAFDNALSGCGIVLSVLDDEIQGMVDTTKEGSIWRFGRRTRINYVWNDTVMKELLQQLRGQQTALNLLINALQMESLAQVQDLLKSNNVTLDKIAQRAKSLRSTRHSTNRVSIHVKAGQPQSTHSFSGDSAIDPREFPFDDEVVLSGPYRKALIAVQQREKQKKAVPPGENIMDESSNAHDRTERLSDHLSSGITPDYGNRLSADSRDLRIINEISTERATSSEATPKTTIEGAHPKSLGASSMLGSALCSTDLSLSLPDGRISERDGIPNASETTFSQEHTSEAGLRVADASPTGFPANELVFRPRADASMVSPPIPTRRPSNPSMNLPQVLQTQPNSSTALSLSHGIRLRPRLQTELAELVAAAISNDLVRLEELLEEGVVSSHVDADLGLTALGACASYNHTQAAKMLLRHGALIDFGDSEGCTPLWRAAYAGHIMMMSLLWSRGANLRLCANNGFNALHAAVVQGQADATQWLLENALELRAQAEKTGRRPLDLAAMSDRTDIVQLFMNGIEYFSKADPPSMPCPSLLLALDNRRVENARVLLRYGARPNAVDQAGMPLLNWTVGEANIEGVKLLLEYGADINSQGPPKNMASPLTLAAAAADEPMVLLLLQSGANPHLSNIKGSSALHYAARAGAISPISLLLAYGANIHDSNTRGLCPIHAAVEQDCADAVKLLIARGARIDAQAFVEINATLKAGHGDVRGSPLAFAAWRGAIASINALLDVGANVEEPSDIGLHPLHFAAGGNRPQAIEILIHRGALVDAKDNIQRTSLLIAARQNARTAIHTLLENGAAIDLPDSTGKTALHHAILGLHKESVKLFLEKGADPHKKLNGRKYNEWCRLMHLGKTSEQSPIIEMLNQAIINADKEKVARRVTKMQSFMSLIKSPSNASEDTLGSSRKRSSRSRSSISNWQTAELENTAPGTAELSGFPKLPAELAYSPPPVELAVPSRTVELAGSMNLSAELAASPRPQTKRREVPSHIAELPSYPMD